MFLYRIYEHTSTCLLFWDCVSLNHSGSLTVLSRISRADWLAAGQTDNDWWTISFVFLSFLAFPPVYPWGVYLVRSNENFNTLSNCCIPLGHAGHFAARHQSIPQDPIKTRSTGELLFSCPDFSLNSTVEPHFSLLFQQLPLTIRHILYILSIIQLNPYFSRELLVKTVAQDPPAHREPVVSLVSWDSPDQREQLWVLI